MSKPKAKTAEQPENKWPIKRTVRKLAVPLTDEDVRNLGRENAQIGAEIEALAAEKKASAGNFTAKLLELASRRSVNDTAISNGRRERETECEWRYELNRRLENDPARKVLVRLDTGVVVDEAFITDDERQLVMRIAEPEQEAQTTEGDPQSGELPPPDYMAAEKKGKGKGKAKKEADLAADKKDSEAEAKANS